LARAFFVVATIFYWASGNYDAAIKCGLGATGLIMSRVLEAPFILDLGWFLAVSFQVGGNIWRLFEHYRYYDKFVHTLMPIFGAPLLFLMFWRLNVFYDPKQDNRPHNFWRLFIITAALGVVAAVCWEIIEFSSDQFLHTGLQQNNTDTMTDLITSGVGSLVGGSLAIKLFARKGAKV
jgi:hypothetical protein